MVCWHTAGVEEPSERPAWRQGVDLSNVEAGLLYVAELFDAVHATGCSMLIRVDGERSGTNPRRFTVAVTGRPPQRHTQRYDDSDLGRAVARAVADFDRILSVAGDKDLE